MSCEIHCAVSHTFRNGRESYSGYRVVRAEFLSWRPSTCIVHIVTSLQCFSLPPWRRPCQCWPRLCRKQSAFRCASMTRVITIITTGTTMSGTLGEYSWRTTTGTITNMLMPTRKSRGNIGIGGTAIRINLTQDWHVDLEMPDDLSVRSITVWIGRRRGSSRQRQTSELWFLLVKVCVAISKSVLRRR